MTPSKPPGVLSVEETPVGKSLSGNGMNGVSEYPPRAVESELPAEHAPPVELHGCPHCSRRFNEKALRVHVKLCQRVFSQKRKQFDSTLARVDGIVERSEIEKIKKAKEQKATPARAAQKENWRREHEQFTSAMRSIKGDAVETPGPITPDPSLVSCPHCSRSFNKASAERHIACCKKVFGKTNKVGRR